MAVAAAVAAAAAAVMVVTAATVTVLASGASLREAMVDEKAASCRRL
jgi:hypothetical protein